MVFALHEPTTRERDVERRTQRDAIEAVKGCRGRTAGDGTGAAVDHQSREIAQGSAYDERAPQHVSAGSLEDSAAYAEPKLVG